MEHPRHHTLIFFYIHLTTPYALHKTFGFVLFEFFENLRLKSRGTRCASRPVYKKWTFSTCHAHCTYCDINTIIFSTLYESLARYNKKQDLFRSWIHRINPNKWHLIFLSIHLFLLCFLSKPKNDKAAWNETRQH